MQGKILRRLEYLIGYASKKEEKRHSCPVEVPGVGFSGRGFRGRSTARPWPIAEGWRRRCAKGGAPIQVGMMDSSRRKFNKVADRRN